MKIPERLALAGGLWLLMASATDAQIISIDEFDTDEPITIAADNLEVDSNSRDVTFTGSVEVRQGELTVFADTMIIHYADETGTGENRVREIRAISNVSVVTPNGTASGDFGPVDSGNRHRDPAGERHAGERRRHSHRQHGHARTRER